MNSNDRFEFGRPRTQRLVLAGGGVLIILIAIIGLILLFTAGGDGGETADAGDITSSPQSLPTLSPTATEQGPPTVTNTPAPTATLEPIEYQVQEGDTLVSILCNVGYCYREIIPTVVALNGWYSENQSLFAGQTILLPRATQTIGIEEPTANTDSPTEQPAGSEDVTQQPDAGTDYSNCNLDTPCVSPDGQYWIHTIQEGETIAGLAFAYGTRVDAILGANGLTPDSFIVPGQQVKVPILVTFTPTITATGGPGSTPTPTPGLMAPALLSPANGVTLERGQNVVLQWLSDHPLHDDEHYLVIIRNLASGVEHRDTTRSNAYRLPAGLQPGAGQSIEYEWQVLIVNGNSISSTVISGSGEWWRFTWGS